MLTDIEILKKAYEIEIKRGTQGKTEFFPKAWESSQVGASRSDIIHLKEEQYIFLESHLSAGQGSKNVYRLTEKGKKMVVDSLSEEQAVKVTASEILEGMDLIIGFDDIKQTIADALEGTKRIHFLLEGPPACAKSLILEAVRSAIPDAYLAFGSRTSGAGLSEVLFERKPSVLLLDEVDKMDKQTRMVTLGVLETGEIIETKSKKSRGIKLNTKILATCNHSTGFTREFKSRFIHFLFPEYTRHEFIDIVIGMLTRLEDCPPEIARLIGETIFDSKIGDIRSARGCWTLMKKPTREEVERVINLLLKYSPDQDPVNRKRLSKAQSKLI